MRFSGMVRAQVDLREEICHELEFLRSTVYAEMTDSVICGLKESREKEILECLVELNRHLAVVVTKLGRDWGVIGRVVSRKVTHRAISRGGLYRKPNLFDGMGLYSEYGMCDKKQVEGDWEGYELIFLEKPIFVSISEKEERNWMGKVCLIWNVCVMQYKKLTETKREYEEAVRNVRILRKMVKKSKDPWGDFGSLFEMLINNCRIGWISLDGKTLIRGQIFQGEMYLLEVFEKINPEVVISRLNSVKPALFLEIDGMQKGFLKAFVGESLNWQRVLTLPVRWFGRIRYELLTDFWNNEEALSDLDDDLPFWIKLMGGEWRR